MGFSRKFYGATILTVTVLCTTVSGGCNDPGSMPHSGRDLSGLDTRDIVVYTCDSGYEINTAGAGEAVTFVMECLPNDRWNASLPSCDRVSCGHPGDRDHSVLDGTSYLYQDIVTYTCDSGYRMPDWSKKLRTTCKADKTWDPQAVHCIRIECVEPEVIPFADRISPLIGPYYLGQTLTYQCRFGYRPKIPAHVELTCGDRGFWVGTWPECLKIRCGDPGMVANASRIVTGNGAGTVLIYSCNHGFYHDPDSGPLNRTCQENSQWTGSAQPRCLGMYCGPPRDVTSASFVPALPTYRFPETIRYTCDTGYRANYTTGIDQITCTWRGEWDFQPYSCERVRCIETALSENTEINNDYFYYQDVKVMSCLSGYEMEDGSVENSRQCEASGYFSDDPPVCQKVRCPDPWALNYTNVNITGPGNEYRDLVTFTCDPGYEIPGGQGLTFKMSAICQEDRTWSSELPKCLRVSCGEPDLRLNVEFVSYVGHLYGDSVVYNCSTGYVYLKGNQTSTCQANRRWSGETFYCEERDCSEPPVLLNGEKIGTNYGYGGRVSFRCNTGFELVGASSVQCEASGDWSDQTPYCQRVTCGQPDDLPHANWTSDVPGQSFMFADSVTYTCQYGYYWRNTSGPLKRSCEASTRWSGNRPICDPNECGDPGDILGTYKLGVKFTYGQIINYTCLTGYEVESGKPWSVVQCQGDGEWTGEWPQCQRIICGDPGPGGNTTREVSSEEFDYASTVRYYCKDGYYYPDGRYLLRCLDTKNWSVPVPHCTSIPVFKSVKAPEKINFVPAEADDASTYGYIGVALIGLEVLGVIILDLATIQKDINLLRKNLNMKVRKAKKKVKEIKESIKLEFSDVANLKVKAMAGIYGSKMMTPVVVAPASSDDLAKGPPPSYMTNKRHMKLRSLATFTQMKQRNPSAGSGSVIGWGDTKPKYYASKPPEPEKPVADRRNTATVSPRVLQVEGAENPVYLEEGRRGPRQEGEKQWVQKRKTRNSDSRGSGTGSEGSGKPLLYHS